MDQPSIISLKSSYKLRTNCLCACVCRKQLQRENIFAVLAHQTISNPTMRIALDFKFAQFDKVRGEGARTGSKCEDWKSIVQSELEDLK